MLYDEGSHTGLYGGQLARIHLFNRLNLDSFNPLLLTSNKKAIYHEAIKYGIKVIVDKSIYRLDKRVSRSNFSFYSLIKYMNNLVLSITSLHKIIKKNKIDIVFPNDNYSRVVVCFSKLFVKIKIATFISDDFKGSLVERILIFIIFSLSDLIFVPSHYLYNKYSNFLFAKKKLEYRNPGINKNIINTNNGNDNNVEVDHQDKYSFCIIGNLIPIKGHPILFRALQKINNNNFICYIIGSGTDDQIIYLKTMTKKLNISNKVKFLGYVKNPLAILNKCDFLISTSFSEASPRVIQESYHCKKPVVATNVGGQTELVIDDITGYLVESNNPRSIKMGILKMLEKNKREIKKMGINGYNFVMENYNFIDSVKYVEKKLIGLVENKQ